jgi:hypothetical protein
MRAMLDTTRNKLSVQKYDEALKIIMWYSKQMVSNGTTRPILQ